MIFATRRAHIALNDRKITARKKFTRNLTLVLTFFARCFQVQLAVPMQTDAANQNPNARIAKAMVESNGLSIVLPFRKLLPNRWARWAYELFFPLMPESKLSRR